MRRLLMAVAALAGFLSACDTIPDFRGDRMAVGQESEVGRLNSRLAGDRSPF